MVRFTILWKRSIDAAAFERHYREAHIPLAEKMCQGVAPLHGEPHLRH